jgi:hypothetical protein
VVARPARRTADGRPGDVGRVPAVGPVGAGWEIGELTASPFRAPRLAAAVGPVGSGWEDGELTASPFRVPNCVPVPGPSEIEIWPATFSVGDPLPELPLRLTGDLFVPVDFEASYQEACRRRRLA